MSFCELTDINERLLSASSFAVSNSVWKGPSKFSIVSAGYDFLAPSNRAVRFLFHEFLAAIKRSEGNPRPSIFSFAVVSEAGISPEGIASDSVDRLGVENLGLLLRATGLGGTGGKYVGGGNLGPANLATGGAVDLRRSGSPVREDPGGKGPSNDSG